jgi:molecular chaperone GrpE (heat shock protein)
MDEKDLEIFHLKQEIEDLKNQLQTKTDESDNFRRELDRVSDALYDIYRSI